MTVGQAKEISKKAGTKLLTTTYKSFSLSLYWNLVCAVSHRHWRPLFTEPSYVCLTLKCRASGDLDRLVRVTRWVALPSFWGDLSNHRTLWGVRSRSSAQYCGSASFDPFLYSPLRRKLPVAVQHDERTLHMVSTNPFNLGFHILPDSRTL